MKVDPISVEVDGKVCDLLLDKIGTVDRFKMCRAINTNGNMYRINVYAKTYKDDLESQHIVYSCRAKLIGEVLDILMEDKSPYNCLT